LLHFLSEIELTLSKSPLSLCGFLIHCLDSYKSVNNLPELRARVIDDECKRHKHQDEEEHVRYRIAVLGEIDIQLGRKNDERDDKRQNRAWPDENKNAQNDKEGVPQCKGNRLWDVFVKALEYGEICFLDSGKHRNPMRVDEVERNRKTQKVWPDVEHDNSIPKG
jgi:hypothetical protein